MSQSPPNSHLEPPQKSVELEDSGAHESAPNSDDEDHFSDASEGNQRSHSRTASGHASPIPRTRVEKVDDNPSHGEVPGTPAYGKREKDSVPDEIEVIPEGSRSRSQSTTDRPSFPEGSPVPRTMVERVDPERPSHGDVPGTDAYEQRKADAVPDLVRTAPEAGGTPEPNPESHGSSTAVPETVVSQVESRPDEGRKISPHAHRRKPSDALPDATETVPDVPSKHFILPLPPVMSQDVKERLTNSDPELSHVASSDDLAPIPGAFSTDEDDNQIMDNNGVDSFENDVDQVTISAPGALPKDGAVDDFDDFAEEQEDMGDDDFGDFDDGFQEPSGEVAGVDAMDQGIATPEQPPTPSVPPLIDFDAFQSVSELNTALEDSFDRLFPASKNISSLPPVEPIQNSSAIFNTDRSLSLWSQLVAPPPLQPQNWVKSRIRRLFLVSLGVPVDLDEILPASKQKKLVLPSIDLGLAGSQQQKEQQQQSQTKDGTTPSTHPDASGKTGTTIPPSPTSTSTPTTSTQQRYSRRRDNPPPELDLSAVGRLCATTDAALDGLTDEELKSHVSELQQVTQRASSVLEYWLKRLDGLIGEKEAFEGVIENLVSHARRVRK